MLDDLNIYLLAYPDNPMGNFFLKTFLRKKVVVKGIIIENKKGKSNWRRLKKKIHKDGLVTATRRVLQVYWLKITKQNIVDLARKNGIAVYWLDKFNSKKCAELLETLDIDLFAIVSAPILKEYVFTKARLGCLNAHPGWLPTYRGLGGNAYAIQNGDSPAVTVHFIDAGIDAGKIIVRKKLEIQPGDTVAKINDRAIAQGAELMADAIHQIAERSLEIPTIDEPRGEMYYAMPYSSVKILNKRMRDANFVQNLK